MCGTPLPNKNSIVCAGHYFFAAPDKLRAAMRMKIKASTEADARKRAIYADQASKHTKALVAEIEEKCRMEQAS